MNPKINAPMEGILEFSPANQRTYFPLATKTAVRYAGVSQLKREGTTLGLFGNGYQDDTDFLETSNKNRLIYIEIYKYANRRFYFKALRLYDGLLDSETISDNYPLVTRCDDSCYVNEN